MYAIVPFRFRFRILKRLNAILRPFYFREKLTRHRIRPSLSSRGKCFQLLPREIIPIPHCRTGNVLKMYGGGELAP